MNNERGGFIITHSKRLFYPFAPEPRDVWLEDIAHGLSNLCRYAGQVPEFYSVAQHSVHVAQVLKARGHSKEVQLTGLLHDAPEAYVIDLPAPIKAALPDYRSMEAKVWSAIVDYFGLKTDDETMHFVDMADQDVFAMEARDLMQNPPEWHQRLRDLRPEPMTIVPRGPGLSKESFIMMFNSLTQKRSVA